MRRLAPLVFVLILAGCATAVTADADRPMPRAERSDLTPQAGGGGGGM